MSVTSRFPYALIQQLRKDVDSLSKTVSDLQAQSTAAAAGALLISLQPMQTTCSCTPHSQIALWGP